MSEIRIGIDPTNPGHYFAMIGILEIACRLNHKALGRFRDETFLIESVDLAAVIDAVGASELAQDASAYPNGEQPIVLPGLGLRLDWWLHDRDMKTWAGQQTPLGIFGKLKEAWTNLGSNSRDPMTRCPVSGRFGLDPSSSWDDLDLGYSPNDDGTEVETAPAIDLLACIGLQRARPVDIGDGLLTYCLWANPIPNTLSPAACAGAFGGASYRYRLSKRGRYSSASYATPIDEGE